MFIVICVNYLGIFKYWLEIYVVFFLKVLVFNLLEIFKVLGGKRINSLIYFFFDY